MARNNKISLCEKHLFEDKDRMLALSIPEVDVLSVLRVRSAYTFARDFPSRKGKEIVDYVMAEFGVQKSIAYEDLKIAQFLLGHFEKASKDFHRWRFNQRNEETREFARKMKHPMAMAKADADYAKYNNLDKEDTEPIDWEKIYIQPFFPTEDPSVIGLKPIPNLREKITKLKKKYLDEIEAVDVEYEDVTFNSEEIFKTTEEKENEKWQ